METERSNWRNGLGLRSEILSLDWINDWTSLNINGLLSEPQKTVDLTNLSNVNGLGKDSYDVDGSALPRATGS